MVSMADIRIPSPAREHLLGLAKGFSKLGQKVVIVTPEFILDTKDITFTEPDPFKNIIYEPIRLKEKYNNPFQRKKGLAIFNFLVAKNLKKIIVRNSIDIVYTRQMPSDIFVAKVCKKLGIINVVEINGLIKEDRIASRKSKIWLPLLVFLEKQGIRFSNKAICVTPKLAETVTERYNLSEDSVFFIPNGVDIEYFEKIPPAENRLINDNPEKITIGFAGNFSYWQGVELIPEAINLIPKEKKQNLEVIMIGDGPARHIVEKMVSNYKLNNIFKFLGYLDQEKYVSHIKNFDICVAPYKGSRVRKLGISPIKVLSYLACHKPVICSDLEDLKFIEEYKLGKLFEEGNAHSFANAIIDISFEKKEFLREMGSRAYEYVARNHDWKVIAKEILSIISYGR